MIGCKTHKKSQLLFLIKRYSLLKWSPPAAIMQMSFDYFLLLKISQEIVKQD